jgi:hypothetical protein
MLLDLFLYDFVVDHQRALRKAAERAAHGGARVLCRRPVIPCVRRFTSRGIPSGVRSPSRRPRSLGRALWFFNLADHDSRTYAWGPGPSMETGVRGSRSK